MPATLVTQSLRDSLIASLSVARAGVHANHLGAEQLHPVNVERLPAHVSSVPMYTRHRRPRSAAAVATATPCCPAPVSAMTRALPIRRASRALGERVVDLVRAGVAEILAFEVDRGAAEVPGETGRVRDRRRPAAVVFQQIGQLAPEGAVAAGVLPGLRKFLQRRHQRLRHEPPAVRPEVTPTVR